MTKRLVTIRRYAKWTRPQSIGTSLQCQLPISAWAYTRKQSTSFWKMDASGDFWSPRTATDCAKPLRSQASQDSKECELIYSSKSQKRKIFHRPCWQVFMH